MRIFVTGATGALGRYAVPALIADGHSVTALARTPAKAAQLREQGATPVEVSLFDVDALTSAFADHAVVANLATAIPSFAKYPFMSAWAENQRIRTEGSDAVVAAARAAGVQRLVQESIAFVYADGADAWIDEDRPVESFPIAEGNLHAESNATQFTGEGRIGVVLRFGLFYGPGSVHSDQMLSFARLRFGVSLGSPDSYTPTIYLSDAGTAVSAALSAGAGVYNVVDDEPLTNRAFTDALCAAAGRKPLLRGPGRLMSLGGKRAAALTRSQRVSNARFKAATGWKPEYSSAREGWQAAATP